MEICFVAHLEVADQFAANINHGTPATKHLGPSAHVYLGANSIWTYDPSALLALAERLNPAGWTDADQITTGLQQAADALERLSRVMARRRRRSRRSSVDSRVAPSAGETPADEGVES